MEREMKLQADGIVVELDVVGYRSPKIGDDYFASNWLIINGRVDHPQGMWSFNRTCLTAIEVERLITWFEAIEQYSEPMSISFIEPNLEFCYTSWPSTAIRILLTRECAPPWLADKWQRSEGIILSFPIDKNDVSTNVKCLRDWLARYPVRASRILSRRDRLSFSTAIDNDNGKTIIAVSGFSNDSSMVAYHITRRKLGDKLLIIVHQALAQGMLISRGLTRSFEYRVDINDNINYVCFGSLSDVVWCRE
jgi:hypothetical protein